MRGCGPATELHVIVLVDAVSSHMSILTAGAIIVVLVEIQYYTHWSYSARCNAEYSRAALGFTLLALLADSRTLRYVLVTE